MGKYMQNLGGRNLLERMSGSATLSIDIIGQCDLKLEL